MGISFGSLMVLGAFHLEGSAWQFYICIFHTKSFALFIQKVLLWTLQFTNDKYFQQVCIKVGTDAPARHHHQYLRY